MSDSEASLDSLSSPSQKFVPQEDDEETLWEVIEITAEKGNTYKVRWKGNDPKTMKPWPQSWVQKSDCTDDLVMDWKRRQKENKKRGGRLSTASKRIERESTSTVGKASSSKLLATPMSKSTHRSASTFTVTEDATGARSRKSNSIPIKSHRTSSPILIIEDDEDDVKPPPPPKPKGTKRKLADATSANSSANHIPKNTAVDVNVKESHKKLNMGRPKKKRKVEVEIVMPEVESEDDAFFSQPTSQSIQEQNYEIKTPKGPRNALEEDVEEVEKQESEEDEAEEERMVEDVLSQASSPPFRDEYDMDDIYATDVPDVPIRATESISKDKGKSKQKEQVRVTPAASPPPKPSKPARTTESAFKDKGKGKQKEQVRASAAVAATPAPDPSPIKIGPPSRKRSLANLRKEAANGNSKPKPKAKERLQIQQTSVINASNAKSTRVSPPAPITMPEAKRRAKTEERSDVYNEPEEFQYPEPVLSPNARAILARFDAEVMGIPSSPSRNAVAKTDEAQPKPDLKRRNVKEKTTSSQPTLGKTSSLKATSSEAELRNRNEGEEVEKAEKTLQEVKSIQRPSTTNAAVSNMSRTSLTLAKDESDQARFGRSKPPSTTPVAFSSKSLAKNAPPSEVKFIQQPSSTNVAASNTPKTLLKSKDKFDKSKSKPPSTATTASSSKSLAHRAPVSSPHPYNIEVIPETDGSQSQSQEAKIPSPQSPPTAESKLPTQKSPTPVEQTNGPSKLKPLRPIPVLSPSTFHPHLPPSSLPEDISEESSQRPRSSKVGGDTDDDDEAPMSSIEQFDSPENKSSRATAVVMASKKTAEKANSVSSSIRATQQSASDIWESDVVKRGVQMAEAAKKKRQQSSRASSIEAPPPPRMTMDEVIAKTRSRSGSNFSVHDVRPTPISEADDEDELDEDVDVDMRNVSTVVAPPASGPRAVLDEENKALEELENAYVDLNGGIDETHIDETQDADHSEPVPAAIDPALLREEEEESSQDVMMDLQIAEQQRPLDLKMLEGGWGVAQPVEAMPAIPETTIPEDTKTDASAVNPPEQVVPSEVIPEIIVSETASAQPPSAQPSSAAADDDHPPLRRSTRSRSHTPMPQPTRTKGKAKNDVPLAPSNGRASRSPAPLNIQATPDPPHENQLTAVIAKLEAELAAERVKLAQQDAALQEQQNRSTEIARQQEETTTLLSDLTTRYEAEKAEWENEKLQLTVQLDSANKAKAMADTDREFFREQYAKASGFVSSVRDENKDLEKRIKIAEEQTQTGVNLVKATFDLRVKALEEDVRAWRRTAEFLIDKDVRTGNDEIRRRAAEEPELRALCQRQQALYAKAQDRILEIEAELDEKRRDYADLEAEMQALKSEVTSLHVNLNEALFKLDRIGRSDGYGDESVDATENGHEFVYNCKWRTETEACREVFATISELEHHLTTAGGHLHHSN